MKKKRFSVEQMIGVLKQAQIGVPVAEVIGKAGIGEQTLYRWRARVNLQVVKRFWNEAHAAYQLRTQYTRPRLHSRSQRQRRGGLTQRDVAERLGMFHSWISKTESGDRRLCFAGVVAGLLPLISANFVFRKYLVVQAGVGNFLLGQS